MRTTSSSTNATSSNPSIEHQSSDLLGSLDHGDQAVQWGGLLDKVVFEQGSGVCPLVNAHLEALAQKVLQRRKDKGVRKNFSNQQQNGHFRDPAPGEWRQQQQI